MSADPLLHEMLDGGVSIIDPKLEAAILAKLRGLERRLETCEEALGGVLSAINWFSYDGTAERLGEGHILWEAVHAAHLALATREEH